MLWLPSDLHEGAEPGNITFDANLVRRIEP